MTVSAHDIARELRARLHGSGADRTRIQKLLYYCQGLHLADTGEALFSERIEAWDNGPVVREVWQRDAGRAGFTPPESGLTPHQSAIVDLVVERFGHMPGGRLAQRTHDEPPWKNTWADGSGKNRTIEPVLLEAYFREVMGVDQAEAEAAEIRKRRGNPFEPLPLPPELTDSLR